ncbi:Y-family DNA polymerase [Corynebacterium epidermidicanis]|uniref:Y-family DNA polymerase n=1 Tax=Corynebacterium epidermidicanis TaxID=1050174 RepID=UPI00130D8B5A|nr:DNA polymerase Y family protein [Corynebacterium epidermidicanis]
MALAGGLGPGHQTGHHLGPGHQTGHHLGQRPGQRDEELALVSNHRVWACSAAARRRGVRRGMKARAAQALSASLRLVERDNDRDARAFELVVEGLDSVVASVEVLRPGLAVVDAGAAARFHGGEERAAQLLLDAAALRGVDCLVGVAGSIETAVLAARQGQVVAPGADRDFLSGLPTQVLLAEESLACGRDTVAALCELGLSTLGEVARLPKGSVVTRFGQAGQRIHHIASGDLVRKVAPAWEGEPLDVRGTPPDPINRVDAAAFYARGLAAALHEKLRAAGVVCQRLKVTAVVNVAGNEQQLSRTWRTHEPLSEAATADRVRLKRPGFCSASYTGVSSLTRV